MDAAKKSRRTDEQDFGLDVQAIDSDMSGDMPQTVTANSADVTAPSAFSEDSTRPHNHSVAGQMPTSLSLGSGVLLFLGATLAIAGQMSFDTSYPLITLDAEQRTHLDSIWLNPSGAVSAIVYFVVAMFLVALAFVPPASRLVDRLTRWAIKRAPIVFGLGGLLLIVLSATHIHRSEYIPTDARRFTFGIILIVVGLGSREIRMLRKFLWRRPNRFVILESAGVLTLVGVFVYLTTFDLKSWQYSSIGDEFAFYDMARRFAAGNQMINIFTDQGVYDKFPMLSSYFAGSVMRIIGDDIVGWKVGYNTPVYLGLIATYMVSRSLYGKAVAFCTLGLLVTAHYLIAFGHTGYQNAEPIFATSLGILCFVGGVRNRSPLLLFVSGICAGLGWYTFYSGRAMILIVLAAMVLTVPWRRWLLTLVPVIAGFTAMLLPMLATTGTHFIELMRRESLANPEGPPRPEYMRLAINFGRSVLAFNVNNKDYLYVSGSLAEPITGIFLILGVGYLIGTFQDSRSRLIMVWFGIGLGVTGFASKYDHVAVTRLIFVLPVVALIAAKALCLIAEACVGWLSPNKARWAFSLLISGILGLSTAANLHRWFDVTPVTAATSPLTVATRVLQSDRCRAAGSQTLMFGGNNGFLIEVISTANPSVPLPELVTYDSPDSWLETVPTRCVIFLEAGDPRAIDVQERILRAWPESLLTREFDKSGNSWIEVIYPASPSP